MKLEVTGRCEHQPQYAHIENVELADDEIPWEHRYINFSGYFGSIDPQVFAAAPDMYEALLMVIKDELPLKPDTIYAVKRAIAKAEAK